MCIRDRSISDNNPDGKITILAINAANVEYAKQLNHLNILEVSLIFSELTTPKNLDKNVANEVIKITKKILPVINFSNKKCNCSSHKTTK